MKTYLSITILFLIFSCKSPFDFNSIKNCSDTKVNNSEVYKIDDDDVDFYNSLSEIEKILLSNKIIDNTSKNAYKEGLSKIEADEITLEKLKVIKDEIDKSLLKNHFSYQSGGINNLIFNCFQYGFKDGLENHKSSSLYLQKDRADYLFANTGLYYNKDLLFPLIEVVEDKDFSNFIFRSSIVLFIYENIEQKLDDTLENNFRNQN